VSSSLTPRTSSHLSGLEFTAKARSQRAKGEYFLLRLLELLSIASTVGIVYPHKRQYRSGTRMNFASQPSGGESWLFFANDLRRVREIDSYRRFQDQYCSPGCRPGAVVHQKSIRPGVAGGDPRDVPIRLGRDRSRQNRRNPARCQDTTVSGFTMISAFAHPGHNRRRGTQMLGQRPIGEAAAVYV
jgi:hypothetical protein